MSPAPTTASGCHGCRSCYLQAWYTATSWRMSWEQLWAHTRTLGLERLTTGAPS